MEYEPQQSLVYLGLGANAGNRLANLRSGLRRLSCTMIVERVSSLYETDPVGPIEQPPYFNAVCSARTDLEPHSLLQVVKQIEWSLGRRAGPVWGPRPLDIDILIYGDSRIDLPDLQVPHARLADRSFVLCPLAELAPDLLVPGIGRSVKALSAQIGAGGVRLLSPPGWEKGDNWLEARASTSAGHFSQLL
ncbi:MAG: 2-amino-4-hydroxy-6-hydroxymethyldihydropteridine diphosphokinase [Dehalococcoidia bacterium]